MKNQPAFSAKIIVFFLFSLFFSPFTAWANPLVLFDSGHAQTAGNADWVIDGGFSDFSDAFRAAGCDVSSVEVLTAEAIKGAAILVLPEPNSVYSPEEETAIVDFVNKGGGLYAIGDHHGSDRNNDGIDSRGVLNRFLPKFGLELNKRSFSEAPVQGTFQATPITEGLTLVGTWGGTSIKALANSVVSHIRVSQKNGGDAYIATVIVGNNGGKVVAMGDSSPYDDGTGAPGDKLYNGYSNPKFQHAKLAANSIKWLLSKETKLPQDHWAVNISDLKSAYIAMKQRPSESIRLLIENSEKNVIAFVCSNWDKKEDLLREVQDPSFVWLIRTCEGIEMFQSIHQ